MTYTPTPGLGSWVPTPPAFVKALEPEWGAVTPFLLRAGSQFRPPPPPSPGSEAYVRDYLEIAAIGELNSTTRTATQSEVAHFWVSTGPQLWNQIYRQMATAPGMNAARAAHIYMIANLAGADAIIAAWTRNTRSPVAAGDGDSKSAGRRKRRDRVQPELDALHHHASVSRLPGGSRDIRWSSRAGHDGNVR
jgi:hypothetical protein